MKLLDKSIIAKIYTDVINDDTPCYVYDLNEVSYRINNVVDYMPDNFRLYYAIKANNNKKVLEHIKSHEKVTGFEIASNGELTKSLEHCTPEEILYTGPAKTIKELEYAISNNIGLINVESIVEAIRINEIAKKNNVIVDVLLRINMDYKIEEAAENMGGLSTKMGIDEKDYLDSYEYINNLSNLKIKGIHVFSASGILNYKVAVDYAEYVCKMVKKYECIGHKIDIVDLGGGLGVDYSGTDKEFDIDSYFREVEKIIKNYSFQNKLFFLELGCYLVATCGYYVSKIIDIKSSKGYKHINLAGGLNHIPTATLNGKHPFYIVNMNEPKLYEKQIEVNNEVCNIDGPLCTAEDIVLWDVFVENANIGDYAVIRQAGAYCYSAAWLEFLSHDYPQEIIYDSEKKSILK